MFQYLKFFENLRWINLKPQDTRHTHTSSQERGHLRQGRGNVKKEDTQTKIHSWASGEREKEKERGGQGEERGRERERERTSSEERLKALS